MFSKSFGYAVRGILYLALVQGERHFVHVEEIAQKLSAPRHFMGKIMKKLVKEGVLTSVKGPMGGFALKSDTLQLPLLKLVGVTDGLDTFKTCVLRWKECNGLNPCPMHLQMESIRKDLQKLLSQTTLHDLMDDKHPDFLSSLSESTRRTRNKNTIIS